MGTVIQTIQHKIDALLEHPVVMCLFLALVILTLLGVGNVIAVGLVGLLLCAAGCTQRSAQVDLWIFLPLTVYCVISMISSYVVYGNIILSYGSVQIIWPLLYLLAATLDGREQRLLQQLCAAWVGFIALHGIGQFAWLAVTSGARRLSGLMGNPNAMGIFLVIGWFAAVRAGEEAEGCRAALLRLEPVVLIALSLTLSMGSFLSLAASRTDAPWTCLLVLAYGGVVVYRWPELARFLERKTKLAAAVSGMGVLVAGGAVLLRPSSLATFAERLEMMRNGLGYLLRSPLLGVGPYQWRLLNLQDGDKYFNTYHIHNVLIHVGVELGLFAMAALAVVAVRSWRKKAPPAQRGGLAAFYFHCMMDTGFFYLGITGLSLLMVGEPRQGGRTLRTGALRLILGAFALVFLYNIAYMLGGGGA